MICSSSELYSLEVTENCLSARLTEYVTIEKAEGTIKNKDENGYPTKYESNGEAIAPPQAEQFELSDEEFEFTYEWYHGSHEDASVSGLQKLEEAPTDQGKYSLLIRVSYEKNYTDAELVLPVSIVDVPETLSGKWMKNATGWWYKEIDGSYPVNTWKKISGKWYHFDEKGYIETGWYKSGGFWYCLKSNGAMAENEWIDGKYYVDENGKWIEGKKMPQTGVWRKNDKGWWYQFDDGTYAKNQWKKIDGKWYHFGADGYMQTGWYKEGNDYYYLKASGAMAVNEWVVNDMYYIDENGHWVP